MIAIVDYESSRTSEIKQAFDSLGATSAVVNSVDRLESAHQIVIPPCTSFAKGIRSIRDRGFIRPLYRAVDDGRAILAIGQGLHLLFDVSYEEGQHTGLGLVHGKVSRFEFAGHPVGAAVSPVHEGWAAVQWDRNMPILAGLQSGEQFYFDHAFFAEPLDGNRIGGTCHHGIDFPALIRQDNVLATEFLPEKSGEAGRRVLSNFARM